MREIVYALADATYGQYVPVWLEAVNCSGTIRDPLPTFTCTNTIRGYPRLLGVTQRSATTGQMVPVCISGWSYCSLEQPPFGWADALVGSAWHKKLSTTVHTGVLVPEGSLKLIGWLSAGSGSYATGIVLVNSSASTHKLLTVKNMTTIGGPNGSDGYAVAAYQAAQITGYDSSTGIFEVTMPTYDWKATDLVVAQHRIASGTYGYALGHGSMTECRGVPASIPDHNTIPESTPLWHNLKLIRASRTVATVPYYWTHILGSPLGCVLVNNVPYHTVVWASAFQYLELFTQGICRVSSRASNQNYVGGPVGAHGFSWDGTYSTQRATVVVVDTFDSAYATVAATGGGIYAASVTELAAGVVRINH